MLNEILTISGKPSLYKLLTRGRGALIVENIDETKKRMPIQGTDKVVSLGDISIFTDEKEMPLREVFLRRDHSRFRPRPRISQPHQENSRLVRPPGKVQRKRLQRAQSSRGRIQARLKFAKRAKGKGGLGTVLFPPFSALSLLAFS